MKSCSYLSCVVCVSRLLISLIRLQFVAAVQLIMLRRCPRTSSVTFHEIMNAGYFHCRHNPEAEA